MDCLKNQCPNMSQQVTYVIATMQLNSNDPSLRCGDGWLQALHSIHTEKYTTWPAAQNFSFMLIQIVGMAPKRLGHRPTVIRQANNVM
jgi:hypothetical protein